MSFVNQNLHFCSFITEFIELVFIDRDKMLGKPCILSLFPIHRIKKLHLYIKQRNLLVGSNSVG